MQPYFFPYLGHFSLIAACDRWVVFDITQYTPKTWMNRNRILHPAGGSKWLTVPLANSSIHIRTCQAAILDPAGAQAAIMAQLAQYRRAPFFAAVTGLVAAAFEGSPASLVQVNVQGLAAVCRYIGLPFRYQVCSALALALPPNLGPGEWAPEICAALGASDYINPVGGRALFDPDRFARHGLSLSFLQGGTFDYATGTFAAEPNLSILDVLMWNSPATVLAAVRDFTLVPAVPGGNDGAVRTRPLPDIGSYAA